MTITLWIRKLVFKDGFNCYTHLSKERRVVYIICSYRNMGCVWNVIGLSGIPALDKREPSYFENSALIHNDGSQMSNKGHI